MVLRFKSLLFAVLAMGVLFLWAQCGGNGNQQDPNAEFDIPDSMIQTEQIEVSSKVIEEMVENISSPVETAALMKRLKVPFNKDYMIPTDAADHFNTNFTKALGLGLYGTDLGYLNMYAKTSEVLSYISAVKDLADGIQVGQFFDFATLKRLATNNENLDSLIYISQQSYNKIDSYLRKNNRGALSTVIVAGVWIEGMYLSAQVAMETKNPQMEETIADQKVVLSTLIPMLSIYDKDANIMGLVDRLNAIKELYKEVKITYEQGEPVTKVIDGKLTIEQKDKQIVDVTPEVLNGIMTSLVTLRNDLVNNK
ncbi:MAG: hypothetical protein CSA97_02400 [Bacteroidetes bacterium]|nr:MAG: hypothetical protein CSA97_02400 [Bacteroidota bacterium]